MLNYKIEHIFSNLEGGWGPGEEFLNTKKAREAISGHFVRTILPSVNDQFQRILLPFIVGSFLNIKFRQLCILSVLVLQC